MEMSGNLVSAAGLAALIAEGPCRVVDCRFDLFDPAKGRQEYAAGHIPGAVYADMDQDLAGPVTPTSGRHPLPDPEVFRRRLESWGIGDDSAVVAYDYGNGALAARLWWMLREWFGHERVAVLDGGLAAWRSAGKQLASSEATIARARFSRTPDQSAVATTEEILGLVRRGDDFLLLDARDPARFRGEIEPIDSKAGHVPGARNFPLTANLGDDGTWLPADRLAARWRETTGIEEDAASIAMCGSGVTACHLVLGAHLAGLPAPRLYVGSWSEWIRDPARPIATGA